MKFKCLLSGLVLVCSSLLAVDGALAQQCRAQLINGSGVIIDSFNGSRCRAVRKRCKRKLRKLRYQDPYFYQYAYCDVVKTPHYVSPSPYPVPYSQPRSYVSPSPRLTPRYQPRSYIAPSPRLTHRSQPRSYVSPPPRLTPRSQPRAYVSPSPRLTPRSRPRPYVSPTPRPTPRSQPRPHVSPSPRPIPQPQSYVTRSYDRCQAPGIVRCTQEWSDGGIVTEDYSCSGCRGYSNPAGDPCGWRCSFPQT
jgi:hypothetical protein